MSVLFDWTQYSEQYFIDEQFFPQLDMKLVKDNIDACNDCEIKLQMYMAHRVSYTNQNTIQKKKEESEIDKLK